VLERARAEEELEPAPPEALAEPDVVEEPTPTEPAQEEQSWFDAIFDSDAPPARTGDERLSSQITSRLRSQVSARLRRLRQPPPGNSITEGEGDA
jgi:hypothetical protein